MKKKILFIISNLESGGVSKSLVSLLNVIDKENYDISVFIVNPTGLFIELLPKNIRIITDEKSSISLSPFPGCLLKLLNKRHYYFFVLRIIQVIISRIDRGLGGILLSKLLIPLQEEFDLIVDYNGQHQLYYMIDKLRAKKKITFFHSDYNKWPFYYRADKKYFPKVDHIFTISESCVESLKRIFPKEIHKIGLIENITSLSLLNTMSKENPIDLPQGNFFKFITVGHVCDNKGVDIAIQAAGLLCEKNIDFKWYFLGNDSEKSKYQNLIHSLKLDDKIIFLGMRSNPYPYIKSADIFVHPSRFEGKSIALDEAKLLLKPIVVTNFSTVNDQFEDRRNASICEMKALSLATAIEELLYSDDLKKDYISTLQQQQIDNSSEINKIYNLITTI